ncbi:MAG: response regulator [Salinivirgaceae bacterium]|nr:response regulator [Salinivirgaceae bacterium]
MVDNSNFPEINYLLYQKWVKSFTYKKSTDFDTYFRSILHTFHSLFASEITLVFIRDSKLGEYYPIANGIAPELENISKEILGKLYHNPNTGVHKMNVIDDSLLNYLNLTPKNEYCICYTLEISSAISVTLFTSSLDNTTAKAHQAQWEYLKPLINQELYHSAHLYLKEQQAFESHGVLFILLDDKNNVLKTNIKSDFYSLYHALIKEGIVDNNRIANNLLIDLSVDDRHRKYLVVKEKNQTQSLIKLLPVDNFKEVGKSEAHESFSSMVEIIPVGVLKVSKTGYITYANKWMLDFLDATNQNLIGIHIGRFLIQSTIPVNIATALRSNKLNKNDFEMNIITKSNRKREASVTSLMLSKEEGAVLIVQDIQERKELTRKIKQKENDLLRLINNKNLIIARTDKNSKILFANKTFLNIVGFTEEGVLGKSIFDFIMNYEPARFDILWAEIINFEISQTDFVLKTPDNLPLFWLTTVQTVGEDVVFSGIDVSELQRTRNMLGKSQRLINQVFDNIPGLVMVISKTYEVLFTNEKENTERYKQGISCHELCMESDSLCENCQLHTVFNEKVAKQIELFDEKTDKTYSVQTIPLTNNAGDVLYALEFFQDITAQKTIQQSIQKSKNAIEKVSKLKSSFISNINHEVRTPLNAILGFSEIILSGNKSAATNMDYVKIIRENGNRLLDTITGLIELSRLQSGDYVVVNETFSLNKLLSLICDNYRDHDNIFSGNVQFIMSLPTNQVFVNTDKNRITNIVEQLLDNAIKYTSKGVVNMALEMRSNNIVIIIQDNGEGMKNDDFNAFFEYFGKDHMKTQLIDGPGLGLAIAYHNAKAIDGELVLVPNATQGTRFEIVLPLDKQEITDNNNRQYGWGKKKILVAEDDDINFLYIEALLSKSGLTIIRAKNGIEALELIDQDIDLVLLDIQMPLCDGISVVTEARKRGITLPIIALTAHNLRENECLKAGCDLFITKPIVSDMLHAILDRFLSQPM